MNHHLAYPDQASGPQNPNAFAASYHAEPSPPYTTPERSPSIGDQLEVPPPKRQRLASPGSNRPVKTTAKRNPRAMTPATDRFSPEDGAVQAPKTKVASTPLTSKSRRVRTGCLTCRERHLKCDEGMPHCNNCRKSNRECKRGVRLNFIDTRVEQPPVIPPTHEWSVDFRDESRSIASEYQGGLSRYPALPEKKDAAAIRESTVEDTSQPTLMDINEDSSSATSLPPSQRPWRPMVSQSTPVNHEHSFQPVSTPGPHSSPLVVNGGAMSVDPYTNREDDFRRPHVTRASDFTSFASLSFGPMAQLAPQTHSFNGLATPQIQSTSDGLMTPPNERTGGELEYLSEENDIRFVQAYVDEVAVWMETLDKEKHFSKTIPILALKSPMLLNAIMACGAKHLALVNKHGEDKAHTYYDNATNQLLACLKDPDRNTTDCATTATILNVYEVMNDKPDKRMTHIAGARALIRECGWDATSTGIGGACFWLSIGLELFSCMAFGWQTAWDPDHWGLDLGFTEWAPTPRTSSSYDEDGDGMQRTNDDDEELWIQRMFYIVAKITNFRATIPRFQEPSPHDELIRRQTRFNEWKKLKGLCDAWNSNCPRSMQPYGYLKTGLRSKSLFPRVWLIKRPAILGRLYYHTALCLLAQINPMESRDTDDNRTSQQLHAHHICGILAHTSDHAVMSGSIRCLAVAGAVLAKREEQIEALAIVDRIEKETGWRLGRVTTELKEAWGWETGSRTLPIPGRTSSNPGPPPNFFSTSQGASSTVSAPGGGLAAPTPTRPNINPLLINADFSNQNHPYQTFYEPPNKPAKLHNPGS